MAVIKQNWDVNVQPLEELSHFAESFSEEAFEIFVDVASEIEVPLLDELKHYPPVPPNSTYERTNKLRDNWVVRIYAAGNEFRMEVSNSIDYAIWVVGSLARIREAAADFQRTFHKANGWQLATDTVQFWYEALLEEYQSRFEDELAEFGSFTLKRRATTRIG
jgi:hypothetical protein